MDPYKKAMSTRTQTCHMIYPYPHLGSGIAMAYGGTIDGGHLQNLVVLFCRVHLFHPLMVVGSIDERVSPRA